MVEVALVLLVDRDGSLLMQQRDGYAPIAPNRWALPGGHIEPGETPIQAAHRELAEETGLTASPEPFWTGPRPAELSYPVTIHAFCGRTDAIQDDVVLGEGLAMVFIPAKLALDRDLAVSAALLLPMFLSSARYAELAARTG